MRIKTKENWNKKLDDAIFVTGLNRQDIADQAGISLSTLCRIICRKQMASQRSQHNLSETVGKPIEELDF